MQLGMVGLGRMGAGMVRRLMRDGHECVVFDVNADSVRRSSADGATGASSLEDFVGQADRPQGRLGHGARGVHPHDRRAARRADGRGRHHHRRRQLLLPRRRRHRRPAGAAGHPLRRLRHQRRRLRARARLLPDGRRPTTTRSRTSTPVFESAGPRLRRSTAHARLRPATPSHRRARLAALRPERRRPLREDGPQRHRVRAHGRLRRGPGHPRRTPTPASERTATRRPRRCATRSTTSTTSTSRRSPRSGAAAAWSPPGCST